MQAEEEKRRVDNRCIAWWPTTARMKRQNGCEGEDTEDDRPPRHWWLKKRNTKKYNKKTSFAAFMAVPTRSD